jgi:hypothetical protein
MTVNRVLVVFHLRAAAAVAALALLAKAVQAEMQQAPDLEPDLVAISDLPAAPNGGSLG